MASPTRIASAGPLLLDMHATFTARVEDRTLECYWKSKGSKAVCLGTASNSDRMFQTVDVSSGSFYLTQKTSPKIQYVPLLDFPSVIAALAKSHTGKPCVVTCEFDLPSDDLLRQGKIAFSEVGFRFIFSAQERQSFRGLDLLPLMKANPS